MQEDQRCVLIPSAWRQLGNRDRIVVYSRPSLRRPKSSDLGSNMVRRHEEQCPRGADEPLEVAGVAAEDKPRSDVAAVKVHDQGPSESVCRAESAHPSQAKLRKNYTLMLPTHDACKQL